MNWLLVSLAVALTLDELTAAMPGAQDTFEQCAASGCSRAEGAKAAFVLAVGNYVTQGRADGVLAATVRALDEDLFASLPDVLQGAATSPHEWADRVGGVVAADPAQLKEERLQQIVERTEQLLQSNGEYPNTDVTISVVDQNGAPLQRAFVRFLLEDERHPVNPNHGSWTGTLLFLDDGREVYFEKGETLRFEVFAPGFATQTVTYVIARKRNNKVQVFLKPASLELASDAPAVAERAHRSYAAWVEADAAYVESPNEQTGSRAESQARDTVDAARAWFDATHSDDALYMCRMVGSISECGVK